MNRHTYSLGVIGNCSYLAYIDTRATVKWLCWPRFDSSFVFGSLLDKNNGGEFSIQPEGEYESRQYYINNTNVLVTEFQSSQGKFRVIDCAPRFPQYDRRFRPSMLVRKVELLEGTPALRVSCSPTSEYGRSKPKKIVASNHINYEGYEMPLRLTTDISLTFIDGEQSFVLSRNCYLVLTYGEPLEAPLKATAEDFINRTVRYWQAWVKNTYVPEFHQDMLIRSALVLKLHQFEDTGGIIASGTTSLPEHHGSGRTWDYRYCWFRDSYYTLKAFNEMGHFDELEKYFEYIENILVRSKERISPLYSIAGLPPPEEVELDLAGYEGNRPVRLGNKAYIQNQNDVYGQILVGLLPLFVDRRLNFIRQPSHESMVDRLLKWIELTLEEPDAGLWEFRNTKQVHTYSLLFHWAGCQAAIKLGKTLNDNRLTDHAEPLGKRAAALIEKTYNPKMKMYGQALDNYVEDASTLKLITMGYLNADSKRAKDHLEALERKLKTEQGLFYRYVHPDDFGKPQATFLVCAFWYVDALACVGRVDDAREILEKIMQFSNHLGLFSEDVGVDGSQWGNFPQTYSHVGLINAIFRIHKKMDQPGFMDDYS